jgi:hypothetical protein
VVNKQEYKRGAKLGINRKTAWFGGGNGGYRISNGGFFMKMSINKLLLGVALFFVPLASFAENPPMEGWQFTDIMPRLNGRYFLQREYGQSFREQDGYAIVNGRKLHYWLYDTYAYHNGNSEVIYNQIVPSWVEEMGYVIDFDNIHVTNPNTVLASSVKALMTQRGCDVSLTLVTKDLGFSPYDYVIINEYSKSKGIYWSTVYPLYK